MYQWTHIELARLQQNGPKIEYVQKIEKPCNHGKNQYENDSTMTLTSDKSGDSFASIKSELLSSELTTKTANAGIENDTQMNQIDASLSSHTEHCVDQDVKNVLNGFHNRLENGQGLQSDCDSSLRKTLVETSTQTEDMSEADCKEKRSPETFCAPPPPPPPPPPPFPTSEGYLLRPPPSFSTSNVLVKSSNDQTPIAETLSTSHQNSQINTSSTILSSASSFCPPPPPMNGMNGVPGPPPLPLPTMWFKSDSKLTPFYSFKVLFPEYPLKYRSIYTALRKAAKHPPKPMISLFWTRILIPKEDEKENVKEVNVKEPKIDTDTDTETDTISKTREKLWQKIDETILENADDLTELFARQPTPKRPREVAKVSKKTVIKVLDYKRSQSVGIFSQSLYRHRFDPQSIQRAIYNWDLSNIGLDLLQQMLEHRATDDELKAIKEAQRNASTNIPLDGPENFLIKFAEISCAPERIACIIFQHEFEETNVQIGQKIKTVRELCEYLMDNDHLSDLFAIILTVGNFMNGGNRYRGQADGFGLDVLGKLRDVKSKDKKITLLHFIVRTFIGKRRQHGLKLKEIVYPVPDAEDVKSAATVDFDVLNEQIEQLSQNLIGKIHCRNSINLT